MSAGFPDAARGQLGNTQQRRNLSAATATIRAKREHAVGEVADCEALREQGAAVKDEALRRLDQHLERLERSVTDTGGTVHWARDAAEANDVVARLVRATAAAK